MSRHRTRYVVASYCDLFVAYVIVWYHKVIPIVTCAIIPIVVTCALKRAAKFFLEGRIVVYLPCNDRGDG